MSNDAIAHFVDLNEKPLVLEQYDKTNLYVFSAPRNIFNGVMYNLKSPWFIITSPISNFRLIKSTFKSKDNQDVNQLHIANNDLGKALNHIIKVAHSKICSLDVDIQPYQYGDHSNFFDFAMDFHKFDVNGNSMDDGKTFEWAGRASFLIKISGVFVYVTEGVKKIKLSLKVSQMKMIKGDKLIRNENQTNRVCLL
jgi:hypothetical protein